MYFRFRDRSLRFGALWTPSPAQGREECVVITVPANNVIARVHDRMPAILDETAATIKRCQCSKVEIRGYTDSVGKPAYNQSLSERRANAVKDYLEAHGVAPGILTAQGFGQENPLASNSTAKGRAENRRVTVQFSAPASR